MKGVNVMVDTNRMTIQIEGNTEIDDSTSVCACRLLERKKKEKRTGKKDRSLFIVPRCRWFPSQEALPHSEHMAQLLPRPTLQRKIPSARQIGLHTAHRHTMLLSREIESPVQKPLPSRHVRSAAMADIHRRPDVRRRRNALRAGRPSGQDRRRPRHRLERTAQLGIMNDIPLGFFLGNIPHDVDVVRGKTELPRLGEVPGCQCKTDGKGKGEPKVCRRPQESIVPPNRGDEPTGRDRGVNGLSVIVLDSNSTLDA